MTFFPLGTCLYEVNQPVLFRKKSIVLLLLYKKEILPFGTRVLETSYFDLFFHDGSLVCRTK